MTQSTRENGEEHVAAASEWVVLNDDRPLNDEELAAFQEWRSADRRHGDAYMSALQTWDAIGSLDADALRTPAQASVITFPQRKRTRWLWAWPAAAAAAAAAAFMLLPTATPTEQYETALAELRPITLADGSRVTLGPRSRLKILFNGQTRKVELVGGEAFFEVVKNPARPFEVDTGNSIVRVLGTKFDVNRSNRGVRVSVLEGLVNVRAVAPTQGPAPSVKLRAGQRTEVPNKAMSSATGRPGAAPVDALPIMSAPSPGAWREGRLVYENVRLADLVDDLNRYYGPGIKLDDGVAPGARLTVGLKAGEVPAFMSGLSAITAVQVKRENNGSYTISRQMSQK